MSGQLGVLDGFGGVESAFAYPELEQARGRRARGRGRREPGA